MDLAIARPSDLQFCFCPLNRISQRDHKFEEGLHTRGHVKQLLEASLRTMKSLMEVLPSQKLAQALQSLMKQKWRRICAE